MIEYEKAADGGLISFGKEDAEMIRMLFNRALNTWQPNPPKELLEIQRKLNE